MKFPDLYKMTSTGKIQQWSIETYHSKGVPCYSVTFGQIDGKKQSTKVEVTEGKNIGRSNETSPVEQCELEAKSLWEKQVNRKGYSEDIPKEKPLRPMLAKNFKDRSKKIQYPVFIQPKLDGCRAITNKGTVLSRTGKEFFGLDHIVEAVKSIPYILDGELFSDKITFQEIVSRVRKSKTVHEDVSTIEYHIYDIVDESMTFRERANTLLTIYANMEGLGLPIKFVDMYEAHSEEEVFSIHKELVDAGHEGSIIRCPNEKYKINGRSNGLLKLKDFIDEECEIVGYKCGKGKFKDVPIFDMRDENGIAFEAVPVGSQEERARYLQDAEKYITCQATVRYFERTDDGKPRFPVIVCMSRDYE